MMLFLGRKRVRWRRKDEKSRFRRSALFTIVIRCPRCPILSMQDSPCDVAI